MADDDVVDLTDSPPLPAASAADPLVISSDDDEDRSGMPPPLPAGLVLPPLRLPGGQPPRPERITTLREVLASGRRPQRRGARMFPAPRTVASRTLPASMLQPAVVSHVMQHSGDEPVEPGVYRPIHARPMLPHERRMRNAQQPPASVAGRQTADGAIDVEDVDPAAYAAAAAARAQMASRSGRPGWASRAGSAGRSGRSSRASATDGEDARAESSSDETDDDDMGGDMRQSFSRRLLALQHPQYHAAGQSAVERFFRSMRAPVYPFHPGLAAHHFQRPTRAAAAMHALDFFGGDDLGDLGDLLSFIEAAAPPPPQQPPPAPLPPLALSARMLALERLPEYSRAVPPANCCDRARDAAAAVPGALEIVCTQCVAPLLDKDPVWATPCGHVMCSACHAAFATATKACASCGRRVAKKRMVHLFA